MSPCFCSPLPTASLALSASDGSENPHRAVFANLWANSYLKHRELAATGLQWYFLSTILADWFLYIGQVG
jgi:hypothetical protein